MLMTSDPTNPRSLHVRVVEGIGDIGLAAWRPLEPPSFYLCRDWLHAVEGMLGPEHPYLVVERAGEVIAVTACQVVRDPDLYAFFDLRSLLLAPERIAELRPWLSPDAAARMVELADVLRPQGGRLLPALLATVPRGYESGIVYHRGLVASERDEVARRVVEAFDELALRRGAGAAAFLYVREASDPHLDAALDAWGYVPTVLGATCFLDLRWPDYDSYLSHFTSSRRKMLRTDVRRFAGSGCTVTMGGAELLDDELAPLQAATQSKHGHRMDPDRTARWYARIRAELGPYVRVSLARREGRVLGFGLFYELGGELHARVVGLDYQRLGAERAYFNLTFHEPIRYAIAAGLRRVDFGLESYEAKMLRGCDLRPVRGWFRFGGGDGAGLPELLDLQATAQLAHHAALRRRFGLRDGSAG
jgi:predicted N-acyltransferase